MFVGAEPSDEVRDRAARTAAAIRAILEREPGSRAVRWVPPENLHLTVWFLGEVAEAGAPAVLEALASPFEEPGFVLQISGLGVFPPSGAPRVLWMGVTQGLDRLARLHSEIGTRLAPWGFVPDDRPYSAHLTLARIKEPPPKLRALLRDTIRQVDADAGSCRIDSLTVFRSRTSPSGARYEPLVRVPLS